MNNSEQITFVIPNRGGTNIKYIIKKIREFYINSQFIVVSQEDDRQFCRGQLFNIAYQFINTPYICFIDNDMFFPSDIDLIGEYIKTGATMLQPLKTINQVAIDGDNYRILSSGPVHPDGKGGATFISKENFEKANGFSNLYIGWGNEDVDFYNRNKKYVQMNITINHIEHIRRENPNDKHRQLNYKNYMNFRNRNSMLDGYKDTIYELTYDKIEDEVRYIGVKNISVKDGFAYSIKK